MSKLLLLFTLLSACCYGQTPVNWNSGSNSVMIAFPMQEGQTRGHNNIGMHPLRNVQQSQPKIYNEATPKVLSLEEKLLLYAQECWEDSSIYKWSVHILGEEKDEQGNAIIGSQSACNVYPEYPDNCLNTRHRYETRTKYIHREPTFMGFIEYLKKK